MKKMKMFLLILSLSGFGFINAQNAQPEFSDIMTRAYTSLRNAESPQDLVNARNTMERISMKFTDQWLPVYYTGYVDIILSFVKENKETKLTYITEAKELAKKLNNYPDADKSEVSTLAGFALNAQVAADPENNGPALFGELIGAYKAAIAIDPSNPRPVYLLARFNRDMAKFMGQTSPEFCKELLKAKELYEARKDKPLYPSWGKEEVTRLLLECDKQ